jgi:hypothetical protein
MPTLDPIPGEIGYPRSERCHKALVGSQLQFRAAWLDLALSHFFPNDRHVGGSFDAQANATAGYPHHGDFDFVTEQYPLAYFSTEN